MSKVLEEPAFNLSVDVRQKSSVKTVSKEASCVPLDMRICARWLRKGASGMAIVKVKLVSGFRVDEESLDTVSIRFLGICGRKGGNFYLSIYLSVCLSVYLSVCLSVYLSFYLSIFLSF